MGIFDKNKLLDKLNQTKESLVNATTGKLTEGLKTSELISDIKGKVNTGIDAITDSKAFSAVTSHLKLQRTYSDDEKQDKASKMLQIIDWAYERANGDIVGLGTTEEMAKKYLEKEGSVTKAVDSMVRWQITAAATTGFVSSLGGLATMPLTLPANIAGVLAIQLRMIGAIAELGGFHEATEEKKTGMYLCLLGAQAGNVLSKTTAQFSIKFTTAALQRLPGTVLTQINRAVGFRLFTKFGETGLVNINKMIPILGGVVGAGVDAFSTYSIAKAAQALFLKEVIDFEKQEFVEMEKVKLMINLCLVSGALDEEENNMLLGITESLSISEENKEKLFAIIAKPVSQKIDFSMFKDDVVGGMSVMSVMNQFLKAKGNACQAEVVYMKYVGKELGMAPELVEEFCKI